MSDWIQDELKPHVWIHKERPIEIVIYTNDDDPDLKLLYIRMTHKGEWVSNYFPFRVSDVELDSGDFALSLIKKFICDQDGED